MLKRSERAAVRLHTSAPSADDESDDDLGFAERALKRARRAEQTTHYELVNTVVPTSNVAERLFSVARAMIGLNRYSVTPVLVQALLILKTNHT